MHCRDRQPLSHRDEPNQITVIRRFPGPSIHCSLSSLARLRVKLHRGAVQTSLHRSVPLGPDRTDSTLRSARHRSTSRAEHNNHVSSTAHLSSAAIIHSHVHSRATASHTCARTMNVSWPPRLRLSQQLTLEWAIDSGLRSAAPAPNMGTMSGRWIGVAALE